MKFSSAIVHRSTAIMAPPVGPQTPFLELFGVVVARFVRALGALAIMSRRGLVPPGFIETLLTFFSDGMPMLFHGLMDGLPSGKSSCCLLVVVVPHDRCCRLP